MIGDVIRTLRTDTNMTQSELGERMGVIKQTISNWENNISTPNIDAIVKLAQLFNIPTDYLLESGVFEDWNLLISNKQKVLDIISTCTARISKELLNGTDNITFAKLVYAFNIKIRQGGDGIGITAHDPIPTYPNPLEIKAFSPRKNDSLDILYYYDQLTELDKHWILGQIADLIKSYESPCGISPSSVAAECRNKKAK